MARRDIGVFVRDIIRKPPAPFPYIAGFHVLMFLLLFLINWGEPIGDYAIDVLWMLGFTVAWLYICDLKKWAATSYILMTVANLGLYLFFEFKFDAEIIRESKQAAYVSALLIPALLFSFFVLFFFRRFNQ